MDTNFSNLYIDLNKKLCRTLTIKSDITADLINDSLIAIYGSTSVDLTDKYSWKYYLNISGDYHTTDTIMHVTSLDTLDSVVFSKDVLAIHKTTSDAYQYGTRYYYSLLERYPEQEMLILGILYPSTLQTAVEAQDGTILSYPGDLIEPQETNLIPQLQSFIYNYKVRWDVTSFGLSDNLYYTAQLAVMYLNLLSKVLNIRLDNCKTNEVHSFHIRQYLASHSKLDEYIGYMTLEQMLFLYRNIMYIENNAGKSDQFNVLIDKLLSKRNIPISEYSVRQLMSFDSNYYQDLTVRRKTLNDRRNALEKDFFSIDDLYTKETDLAIGNSVYYETETNNTTLAFKVNDSSVNQTKDLESAMVDYTGAIPDPLVDVLLREWAHMSLTGKYTAVVSIDDPVTLQTSLLTAADAFIYSYYITLKSIGVNVVDLPIYVGVKYRKTIIPTIAEMLDLTELPNMEDIATLIHNEQPLKSLKQSTVAFYTFARKVYEEAYKHWFLISSMDELYERCAVAKLVDSLYGATAIELPVETNDMTQWLLARGLPVYSLTKGEADALVLEIFKTATGYTIDKTTILANIQRAMIDIFTKLKSYTTQTIVEINESSLIVLNPPTLRVGDKQYSHVSDLDTTYNIGVFGIFSRPESVIKLKNIDSESHIGISLESSLAIDIPVGDKFLANFYADIDYTLYSTIDLQGADYDTYDPSVSNQQVFIGYETYLQLTEEEQRTIPSIY